MSRRPRSIGLRRVAGGPGRHPGRGRSRDQGQATVEFALVLPVVFLMILALLQVGLVALDAVLLAGAAREAARTAAVDDDAGAARTAASQSVRDAARLTVSVGPRGESGSVVRVTTTYRAPTDVPLVGELLGDVVLTQQGAMRVE